MTSTAVRRLRRFIAAGPVGALLGVGLAVIPTTTVQASVVHHTKAAEVSGALERSEVRPLPFPTRHAGIYWTGNPDAVVTVAFSRDGLTYGPAIELEHDEVGMQRNNGQTYAAVVSAYDATVAKVTTDRPLGRLTVVAMAEDGTSVQKTPAPERQAGAATNVLPRSGWGADEDTRFRGPKAIWPPVFQTVQKLAVHHTAGTNGQTGLEAQATIRSIYHYHAVTQGWGDIGYNFLMDAGGVIYKGRSTSATKTDGDVSGENLSGQVVTAGHAYGYNSGTVGVAVLGNYVDAPLPEAVDGPVSTPLKDFLFSKATGHGLYAAERNTYTNPVNGTRGEFENIPGHSEIPDNPTECPGGLFLERLRNMRSEMAALMMPGTTAAPDRTAPAPPAGVEAKKAKRAVTLNWSAVTVDEGSGGGASGVVGYHVYRVLANGELGPSPLGSTTDVTFTDKAPLQGTNTYVVKTFDGAANQSTRSNQASAVA